jgi:hypothetical protein
MPPSESRRGREESELTFYITSRSHGKSTDSISHPGGFYVKLHMYIVRTQREAEEGLRLVFSQIMLLATPSKLFLPEIRIIPAAPLFMGDRYLQI